jgi:AcrR family transcriptional regulator
MSTRSDAVRNRKRVLDAAIFVYRARGPELEVREVAERAGVGVGTVYRHFADREQLIDAVAQPFFEELVEIARAAREELPPEDRLFAFVREYAATMARRGVRGHCSWDSPASWPVRLELRQSIGAFLQDGLRSGALRDDLTREDAASLLRTTSLLVDETVGSTAVWRRQLELMLDGLRAAAKRPLSVAPVPPAEWSALVGVLPAEVAAGVG